MNGRREPDERDLEIWRELRASSTFLAAIAIGLALIGLLASR